MVTRKEEFQVERAGSVMTIRFVRPEKRNALTFATYDSLVETCRSLKGEPGIRALVITGGKECFAAGTDMHEFDRLSSAADYLAYEQHVDEVAAAIEDVSIPTIAAVGGACTGGGAVIATACDLRLAAANVRFGFPIARTLGNCVSIANYARVVTNFGGSRAARMFLGAELLSADELAAAGFVAEVVSPEELEDRALTLAERVAALAPRTIVASKTMLRALRQRALPDLDGEAMILFCYQSEDFKEGRAAFLEKRPPHFTGR